ncbi:NAD(P)H-hydrate epimerase [Nanoarchaeota archaeon]
MMNKKLMLELENATIAKGITRLDLMEKAGAECAKVIQDKFEKDKHIVVVCGPGNNGGDGFVIARHLNEADYAVNVVVAVDINSIKDEAKEKFMEMQNKLITATPNINKIDKADVIVDCILGTGAKGEIKGIVADVIDKINATDAKVVSIDVPSGVDPDTGEELNKAIKCDLLICYQDIWQGLEKLKDKTVMVDIGLGK